MSRIRGAPPDPRIREGRGRQPGSLAAAFAGATLVPFLVGGAAGAVAEAALSLVVRGQRLPFALAIVLLTLTYAAVATGTLAVVLRGAVRAALEGFSWQGRWEWLSWREHTGRVLPSTPRGLERWLDETRNRRDLDLERIEPLMFLRRFDEAAVLAEGLAQETAWDRFERAVVLDWIDFVRIGRTEPDALRELASELTDAEERLHADGMIAVADARARLVEGRPTDWLRPLSDFRRRLGSRADRIIWREFLPCRFRAYLFVGFVLAVAMALGLPT